ncbi:LamB/YcsF family protein [Paenibacillus curdlanolyticus YK9]|uniref:5-oxoprolinase subunit A n=1 Tax=Paenibacillus curdlanolyticus YK9 TaxID=717606 RepID=E0I6I1_9BACL|nr:5-oxoprolinase subunit PxpA [Paenibacillus curdlanolyticus]EFM11647.1 LamB/YcsF family protein [Paenibacillus curdlanolyticus YK9]
MSQRSVDLNADFGEGFGAYAFGQDDALLPYVTSVNIACGFHAGDPHTMRAAVNSCIQAGVAIGAHPGLPDRLGFGRREMAITPQEAYDFVLYQVGALKAFVRTAGGQLRHVKPHGALYHMANNQAEIAHAIARAVRDLDPHMMLYAQSGSILLDIAKSHGLRTVSEVFADRTYQADGSLTPRSQPNAVLDSTEAALQQAIQMVKHGTVLTAGGREAAIMAQTICLHGDGPHAAQWAAAIRNGLEAEMVRVQAPQ